MRKIKLYIFAQSFLSNHPNLKRWMRNSYLYRTMVPCLFDFSNIYSDRRYMTDEILPALAALKIARILFVGCKAYTARYGKRLIRAGIDYWTTDIVPAASIWGEHNHHIVTDIAKIDHVCAAESFDAVLLNGVIGHGIDDESEINRAIEAISRILRPNGLLLIGWNSDKRHPDPITVEAVARYFRRMQVLPLPLRKTFPDTDHVYDWLVKTNSTELAVL
jgi:SAM-dependent methyltransferase